MDFLDSNFFSFFFIFILGLSWSHAQNNCQTNLAVLIPFDYPHAWSWIQFMEAAVDDVNDRELIPNCTLGLHFFDTFADDGTAFFVALDSLAIPNLIGVIGGHFPKETINMQLVLKRFYVPQISASCNSNLLSNSFEYPYFTRLVPMENLQGIALAELMNYFSWKSVCILTLSSVNAFGLGIRSSFLQKSNDLGIKITYDRTIYDSEIREALEDIKKNRTRVILVFADEMISTILFFEAWNANMLTSEYVWIVADRTLNLNNEIGILNFEIAMKQTTIISTLPNEMFTSDLANRFNDVSKQRRIYPHPYSTRYYDSVYIFAEAIKRSMEINKGLLETSHIMEEIKYGSYKGVIGNISFNFDGDLQNGAYNLLVWTGDRTSLDPWEKKGLWMQDIGIIEESIFPNGVPLGESTEYPIGLLHVEIGEAPLQGVSAVRFAVEQVNNWDLSGLPIALSLKQLNRSISLVTQGTKSDRGEAINGAYSLLSKKEMIGIVGPTNSASSQIVAIALGTRKIATLSPSSTSTELSNHIIYPFFFRNVPNDAAQALAMVDYINYFGWRRVAVLHTTDNYGEAGSARFQSEAAKVGIEILALRSYQPVGNADSEFSILRQSKAKIFVLICPGPFVSDIVRKAMEHGIIGTGYVWLGFDSVSTTSLSQLTPEMMEAMRGMLVTIPHRGTGKLFQDFVSKFSKLDATIYPFANTTLGTFTTYHYDTVLVYADSLARCLQDNVDPFDRTHFFEYLLKTDIQGLTGRIRFDSHGDRVDAEYELLNWQGNAWVGVSEWNPEDRVSSFNQEIIWPGNAKEPPSDADNVPATQEPEASKRFNTAEIIIFSLSVFLLSIGIFFLVKYYHQKKFNQQLSAYLKRDSPPLKNVTLMFTDIQSSTYLWECDPEMMNTVLKMHDEHMRKLIAIYHGYEITTEGDAFHVAFHSSLDAVKCALQFQTSMLNLDWPKECENYKETQTVIENGKILYKGPRVRIGLHTGNPTYVETHPKSHRMQYFGQLVKIAKQVSDAASGGQILLTADCWENVNSRIEELNATVISLGEYYINDRERTIIQVLPNDFVDITPDGRFLSQNTRTYFSEINLKKLTPSFWEAPTLNVTLVFTYIDGMNEKSLWDRHPKMIQKAILRLNHLIRTELKNFDGYECHESNGEFMLAFHTESAAVEWAAQIQERLLDLEWPQKLLKHDIGKVTLSSNGALLYAGFRLQIGIVSGEPTSVRPHSTSGRTEYHGQICNRASRVARAAHPGQILLGWDVMKNIHSSPNFSSISKKINFSFCGYHRLKGVDEDVPLWQAIPYSLQERTFPPPKTIQQISVELFFENNDQGSDLEDYVFSI